MSRSPAGGERATRAVRVGGVALLALVVATSACDASESAPADPATRGPGSGTAPAAAAPAERGDPFVRPEDDPRPRIGSVEPPATPAEAPPGEAAEAAPEAQRPPERDLSAELRTLAGDPSSCLSGISDLPDEIAITVEATVTATGVITRSYARGGGIPEDAVECVRRRLDGARMRAPIENAPRSVTAILELRRRAPEKTEP